MKIEKLIVLTSVGTLDSAVRERTYELLKKETAQRFSDWTVISAYTSRFLLKKNTEKTIWSLSDVQNSYNLKESKVILFPTHLFFGEEYDNFQKDAREISSLYDNIAVGKPFLEGKNGYWILDFLKENIFLKEGEALLCIGHGSKRKEGFSYKKINEILNEYEKTDKRIRIVETLKGEIPIEEICKKLRQKRIQKVILTPFLLAAGGHAARDIFGKQEGSWESRLIKAGYGVNKIEKGLLEYPKVREQYIKSLQQLVRKAEKGE